MQSLEKLTMEHALIGRGLGALELMARMAQRGEPLPDEAVGGLLDFFEVFGDRYHHVKEEHILIPRLEEGCRSRFRHGCGSSLGDAYHDHEFARGV